MPVGYTEMYAQKLNELSPLTVVEAQDGSGAATGHASPRAGGPAPDVPPRRRRRFVTHLDVRPLDTPHRPSVDVLFQSAAEVYDSRVLGVVMTGMGATAAKGRRGSRRAAAVS